MDTIRGFIHNHIYNTDISAVNLNFENRYPSPGDWVALDALVNPPEGRPGATQPLSIYILDPFGVLREFKAEDRALYESLTKNQRQNGQNLPAETDGCSSE